MQITLLVNINKLILISYLMCKVKKTFLKGLLIRQIIFKYYIGGVTLN